MLNKLYQQARPVPTELAYTNKYTFSASLRLIEVKYLDINDALTQGDNKLSGFIAEYGQVLLFPNLINGTLTDITLRSMDGRGHLKLGSTQFPYNVGNLRKDFRYGDPIYLVEGIGDLVMMKLIDPDLDIIAMQTSAMGKRQIDFLKDITNNFILIRDNDIAGERGARNMGYTFKHFGVNLEVYNQFHELKDTGQILELVLENTITPSDDLVDKITLYSKYYKAIIDVFN